MAFKPILSKDILTCLAELNPHYRKRKNPLKQLTIGLTDCYSFIATQRYPSSKSATNDIDSSCQVLPQPETFYTDEAVIGSGAFSIVTQARNASGQVFAVKKVSSKFLLLALREIIFMRYLQRICLRGGCFFLSLADAFMSNEEGALCLVMDMCQCTLLDCMTDARAEKQREEEEQDQERNLSAMLSDDVIRPIPRIGDNITAVVSHQEPTKRILSPQFVTNLRHIATRMVSALIMLKTEGIIHADIKPENIFIQHLDSDFSSDRTETAPAFDLFSTLPHNHWHVKLGDFGNSFHKSEVLKFYDDFDIQSLPYRAPEVLLGVPFGEKIDMWSLGNVLLELCLGQTLFFVKTREEMFREMSETFGAPSPLLFAGGKYSDLCPFLPTSEKTSFGFADHMARIYTVLSSRGVELQGVPGSLFHFLAAITHFDPEQRLSAVEAMQHDFLVDHLPVPAAMTGQKSKQNGHLQKSLSALRNNISRRNYTNHTALSISPGAILQRAGNQGISTSGLRPTEQVMAAKRKTSGLSDHSRAENKQYKLS